MAQINTINLDLTERLREHAFAVEYVKAMEEAVSHGAERIAELERMLRAGVSEILNDLIEADFLLWAVSLTGVLVYLLAR